MRESKQVEEDEIEDRKEDRKYRQRASLTEGKCDREWFNDEGRIGPKLFVKEIKKSLSLSLSHNFNLVLFQFNRLYWHDCKITILPKQ